MSAFAIGGNIGFALGPIVATPLVLWLGHCAADCCSRVPPPRDRRDALRAAAVPARVRRRTAPSCVARGGRRTAGALTILLAVIGFRSLAWWGLLDVRPAVGGVARALEGARQPPAGVDAARRRARHDRRRARSRTASAGGRCSSRRSRRPAPLIFVFVVVGGAIGAARARASSGITRRRHVRRDDGDGAGVPAAAHRAGLRAVDRALDRPRRRRAPLGLGALADAVDLQAALYVSAARAARRRSRSTLLLPSTRRDGSSSPRSQSVVGSARWPSRHASSSRTARARRRSQARPG